jgi:hypothetical protein
MKARTWLPFFLMLGCLSTPALPPLLYSAMAATAWAQPAPVLPDGPDSNPPDDVVDDGGGDGDGGLPPDDGLLPEEPMPKDSAETTSGWIVSMPTGTDWAIGLGVLLALWVMIYTLYRSLISGWVRKLRHPANLRALLIALAALVFVLWSIFWFFYFLASFGWWMMVPLGLIAIVMFSIALTSKK